MLDEMGTKLAVNGYAFRHSGGIDRHESAISEQEERTTFGGGRKNCVVELSTISFLQKKRNSVSS